jgi:tetratricopeptide (TPR) repeat protein
MMESPQRVRKRERISVLFRRKDQTPSTSEAPQSSQIATESADRQRTKARYREAAKLLEEAVKGRESQWGKVEFPVHGIQCSWASVPPCDSFVTTFLAYESRWNSYRLLIAGAEGLAESVGLAEPEVKLKLKSKFRLRFKSKSKPRFDSKLKSELRHILSSQSELAKVLLELEKFSLIKWDRQHQSISIHHLVQMVVRDDMPGEELAMAIDALMDLIIVVFPEDITNETRPICRRYQAQVVEPLVRLEEHSRKVLLVKSRVGRFLSHDGKHEDGEKLLESTFQISEEILGPADVDTLFAMLWLSWLWDTIGRETDAIELNENLVERCRTKLGDDNWYTFASINSLAAMYRDNGRVKEAIKIEEEVLKKARTVLGEDNSLTLRIMRDLAISYLTLGNSPNSADLELLSKTHRRLYGDEHSDTIATLVVLTYSYYRLGRFEEAAKLGEEVLEKRSSFFGMEHPDTLTAMAMLSGIYDKQGRKREALKMGKETLAKRRVVLGQEHQDLVKSIVNVAYLYRKEGENEEAVALEKEAQEVRQRISARVGNVQL